LSYIWQHLINNNPVENYNVPVQQEVVENYNAPVQRDTVENYNNLVQQNTAVDEDISQSAEYSDHRSMFVDGTSLDFVYWNSYVILNKLYIIL